MDFKIIVNICSFFKTTFICLGTLLFTIIKPTIPFAIVLFFAIILDCLSAYDLSRRMKKKYPNQVTGKFKSEYALKMLGTFFRMYGVILFMFLVDKYVVPESVNFNLVNWTAFACCLIQLWSILENASSENGHYWAKILQKIMVNKANRHFDIDLTIKKEDEN